MSETETPEPTVLDSTPFKEISAQDLERSSITGKALLESIDVLALFNLRTVSFDEIPFIGRGQIKEKSWMLTGELLKTPALSDSALERMIILVRLFPENKLFVSNVKKRDGKRVFEAWQEADETGQPLREAKTQPLLLENNLLKIQRLETDGSLRKWQAVEPTKSEKEIKK